MKRVIIVLMALFLFPSCASAYAPPSLDGEEEFNERVEEIMTGELKLSPIGVINTVWEGLTRELKEAGGDILMIVLIAAVSGIITVTANAFGSHSGGEAAFFAAFTLMSMAAVQCFTTALGYASDVIGAMNGFMTKFSPLFMMLLMACGSASSASAYYPVLSGAVYVISIVIKKCLIPMITFSAVLAIAGNLSDKVQISNFCKVVKSVSKWLMAAIITVFTGISSIYGFSAPALDALSAKTIKFAVGSMVPVVGSFLSDTLETVVSGSRLMKNAAGTSGMIIICVLCAVPVIKIGVIQLMLKIAAAFAEPLADKRISGMLWQMSEAVTTVFAVVVMTAVLFLINMAIILAATSYSL